MKPDPNGPEGDRFMAWWDSQNTGLGAAYRMACWNAWIARSRLDEAPREVWIPVSERLPEPLSTVVYWDQMAGFSVADEWDNEHHLPGATHWLNVSAPSRSNSEPSPGGDPQP